MKVVALAAELDGGVFFYRMSEPARVARTLGVEVTLTDGLDADVSIDKNTGMTRVNEVFTDADLIIVQRPLRQVWTSFIEQAKRQGIATIVEVDDDYDSVHPKNLAYKRPDPADPHNPYWVGQAALVADHVTVSATALEKYAPHKRSTVLRNCVPESYLSIEPKTSFESPVIGWTGTVQTHPYDLQETRGGVADVVHKNKLSFGVVGDDEDVLRNLGIYWQTTVTSTGWVPREEYMQAIADTFTIGIVPLEISPFNNSKSGLKGIEMASLGIPFVASPTREYERLEAYGIGKTAKTPGEWRKQLQRLVDRPAEREKLAKQYREILAAEMTYEKNVESWVFTWEKAIAHRRNHLY